MLKQLLIPFYISTPLLFLGINYPMALILILLVLIGFFVAFYGIERYLLMLLYGFLPLSMNVDLSFLAGAQINLPSEYIAVVLFFATCFVYLNKPSPLKQVLRSPIFYAICLFTAVYVFTTFFTTSPVTSMKFVAINVLYISVGFFLTFHQLITQRVSGAQLFHSALLGLILVCIYFYSNVLIYGANRTSAPLLPKPFFNDHTIFSATLSLFIPFLFYAWKTSGMALLKQLYPLVILLFFSAIYFSYSRATWIGLTVAFAYFISIYINLNWRHFTVFFLALTLVLYANYDRVEKSFITNNYDSNRNGSSVSEQLQSVTNINSDVSNKERINRWKCALRMGAERPLHGFGPGTYQFEYIPFQRKADKTRISMSSPFYAKFGHGGSAHSEYLLAFAESGVWGVLAWGVLLVLTFYSFVRTAKSSLDNEKKWLARAAIVSLTTFFTHAVFNNFLNIANFGIFFWTILSVLAGVYASIPKAVQTLPLPQTVSIKT